MPLTMPFAYAQLTAGASSNAAVKVLVELETTGYMERLDKYEAEERERLEARGAIKPQRAGRVKETKEVERTVNTTDPNAGMLGRRGKPERGCTA